MIKFLNEIMWKVNAKHSEKSAKLLLFLLEFRCHISFHVPYPEKYPRKLWQKLKIFLGVKLGPAGGCQFMEKLAFENLMLQSLH